MGQAADSKVIEIDEARAQLELDLQELEDRLPAPLRSMKSLVGMLLGTAVLMFLALRRFRSKRSASTPAAEVVVRIVREDR
jgi:hypothetical protein